MTLGWELPPGHYTSKGYCQTSTPAGEGAVTEGKSKERNDYFAMNIGVSYSGPEPISGNTFFKFAVFSFCNLMIRSDQRQFLIHHYSLISLSCIHHTNAALEDAVLTFIFNAIWKGKLWLHYFYLKFERPRLSLFLTSLSLVSCTTWVLWMCSVTYHVFRNSKWLFCYAYSYSPFRTWTY